MRRRSFLRFLASTGTVAIAGCTSGPNGARTVTPTEERSTEATTRPTATTPRPGDVPTDRVFPGEAVSQGGIGVTADRWFGLESVRYRDGDDVRTVTTEAGWFLAYEFTVRNRGDGRASALPDAELELHVDGESYAHIHEFPDGVAFAALDQPSNEPQIRELAWYDGLDSGESISLQLVYEAPVRLDYRHYLAWDHREPVEGASEPVYLTGRRVSTGA